MAKKKVNKDTKKYQAKILKRLKNKCLKLWSLCVRKRAGNKCQAHGCNATEYLNAHHIENYMTNQRLRYSMDNGICLCAKHHKYSQASAHRSFLFMLTLLLNTPQLHALKNEADGPEEAITTDKLEEKIKTFENYLKGQLE